MAFLLHQLLSEAAVEAPERVAIRTPERTLTYGELNAAANAVASTLIDLGVCPRDRVGISLPRGIESAIAMYATLKAGAAYVGIDPHAPAARAAGVGRECDLSGLVTSMERAVALASAGLPMPRAVLATGDAENPPPGATPIPLADALAHASTRDPAIELTDLDMACIITTSGSTGTPKGVVHTHATFMALARTIALLLDLTADDRWLSSAPMHFVGSAMHAFPVALRRASSNIVPDEDVVTGARLAELVAFYGATVLGGSPLVLAAMARSGPDPAALATVRKTVFGGSSPHPGDVRALLRLLPGATFWNALGSSEAGIVSGHRFTDLPAERTSLPIGRGVPNADLFALRVDGEVAGPGEEGELCVRSSMVSPGYWRRPDLTAESLVSDPRRPDATRPAFRTGDLVRIGLDGVYELVGRRDHMVKVRGFRVELGDVEHALCEHPDVAEAAVVAVPHPEWGSALVAFVVPFPGSGGSPGVREVLRFLANRVPRYMMPTDTVFLEDLPRTSTQKIDRMSLRERAVDARMGRGPERSRARAAAPGI